LISHSVSIHFRIFAAGIPRSAFGDAMRAAKAAKDLRSVVDPLVEHLIELLTRDADQVRVEYLMDNVMPLLKDISTHLCAKQPKDPKLHTLMWLEEQGVSTTHSERQMVDCETAQTEKFVASTIGTSDIQPPSPPLFPRPSALASDHRRGRRRVTISVPASRSTTSENESSEKIEVSRLPDKNVGIEPSSPVPRERKRAASDSAIVATSAGQLSEMWEEMSQQSMESKRDQYARRRRNSGTLQELARYPSRPELMDMLRTVPVFSTCTEAQLDRIADITVVRRYEQDQVVVNYGQLEDDLHIILEGNAKVSIPQVCGQLGKGDLIGLDSLRVSGSMSSTQVSAMSDDFTTVSIPRSQYEALQITQGLERRAKMMKAVARITKSDNPATSNNASMSCDQCPASGLPLVASYSKTPHDRDMIMAAVKNNRVLGEVMSLTDEQCGIFVETVHLVHIESGKNVFSKGDRGTAFFIVHEGILKIHVEGSVEILLRHGDTFGELALMYDEPRNATIEARMDCKLWVMPQKAFSEVTQISARRKLVDYTQMLQKVPALKSRVDPSQFEMLASVAEETVFVEGDDVCRKGEDKGILFLVVEGECMYEAHGEKHALRKGDWIGEEQLIEIIPATTSVEVVSSTARVLILDVEDYNFIVKPSDESPPHSRSSIRRQSRSMSGAKLINKIQESKDNGVLKKCEVVGALGEGSFGSVMLVQHKDTKKSVCLERITERHFTRQWPAGHCAKRANTADPHEQQLHCASGRGI